MTERPPVFLLHGIGRTARCMRRLAHHLDSQGFAPHSLDYPSTRQSLSDLADWLHARVAPVATTTTQPVHFVGYSMGGLVIRAYLHRYPPARLGRIVMLGTPNSGSEIADILRNVWLFHRFYGPAGQQLITDQSGFAHLFAAEISPQHEFGIIAGNRSFDPLCAWLIKAPSDGKVAVSRTHLIGQRDHLVLPVDHTFMPGNKIVMRQTAHFLTHGLFHKDNFA